MKVLCVKNVNGENLLKPVAVLTESDISEISDKLSDLEKSLKNNGAVIGEYGLFQIVDVDDVKFTQSGEAIFNGKQIANGFYEFLKQVEVEIAKKNKMIEEKKFKSEKKSEETESERLKRLREEDPFSFNWEMHGIEPTESGYYD